MDQKFLKKLHVAICQTFKEEYGGLVSKIELWEFNYVDVINKKKLKHVLDKYGPYSLDDNFVPDAFDELVSKGYLEQKKWGFCLTEAGYNEGMQSRIQKFVVYLNKNPGWAIIMSFMALIISIGSLYFSYKKP